MENETDTGSEDSREVLEDVSSTNTLAAAEYERAVLSGTVYPTTLTFVDPPYFSASLKVEYWWAGDGTVLYGYARQYRAANNGRSSGDITFAVRGTSGQNWERLLTDRAVQDGEWHDIDGGGGVSSPQRLGELYFKFIFDVNNGPDPSQSMTVKIVNPPTITPIAEPLEWRQDLTITGVATTGTVTLTMQSEGGEAIAGAFSASGATRIFTPRAGWAPPGQQKFKVVQLVNGISSPPSALVTLKVRPMRPVITPITQPISGRQTLTIRAVEQGPVTLTMLTGAGATVVGDFSGSGNTRTFTPATAWAPPGEQTFKVVQTVGGVPSDPSELVTLKVKPPKPTITPISQSIEGRHALTITGIAAGTVTLTMLTDAGATVAGTYTGNGTSRTFTPTAVWTPPGEKRVKVVQTVGGVPSDPSDVVTLKVKPPKPAIIPVTQPVEGRHALTITGAQMGVADLTMLTGAGVRIDGTYSSASGGNYTFTPTEAWPPGEQTVKVVQT
ncbi:hypothetical protein, partial [Pseudomonas nunensis]|uniref:hypothetical protein n=1 Tax=Pseudomonas nunensis TaxID=2961896 RepID=UPI0025B05F1F